MELSLARPKRWTLLGLVCLGVVSAGAVGVAASRSAASRDTEAVTDVVEGALMARQQIGAVDALFKEPTKNAEERDAGVYEIATHPALAYLPEELVSSTLSLGEDRLRKYFTGEELADELKVNERMADSYTPMISDSPVKLGQTDTDSYVIDGGADQFSYTSVEIEDNAASVAGSARIWLSGAMIDSDAGQVQLVNPSNLIDFTAHLVATDGSDWKIDKFSWSFAPGSEP
ncbi:hypothetical protein [Nocardioides sp.]|uniref:hypothetical protein n=1 Tax=Nocardioides sp. TaxID=35761 RepID=UPI0039E5499F